MTEPAATQVRQYIRARGLPYNPLHDPESRECRLHPRIHFAAQSA